jgi:hypothetical protein
MLNVYFVAICWLGIVAAEGQYQLQVKSLPYHRFKTVMLLVRTYVVWGCDRKFLIVLLVFTTVTVDIPWLFLQNLVASGHLNSRIGKYDCYERT